MGELMLTGDVITTMPGSIDETLETYDVCLSFAAEQRSYVEEVAALLVNAGLRVFYDNFETADLWGRDLYEHLDEVYSRRSRFCVMFTSADYSRKVWTNHERAAAQERALNSKGVYVLPVRFDETKIPGLRSSVGYIDAKHTSPAELVTHVLNKLGRENRIDAMAVSVLAVASESTLINCEESLRAAVEGQADGADITIASHAGGTAVAVIPVAEITLPTVLTSVVPALEKALAGSGTRARVVLHRGEIGHEQGLNSVDVAGTVSAAAALARSHAAAGPRGGCVVAISLRAHAELVRAGAVAAPDFRKVDVASHATSWDLYVRADEIHEVAKSAEPAARVNTTVEKVIADSVIFGIQVNGR